MNNKIGENKLFKGMTRLTGSAVVLLVISAGLTLFARRALGWASVGTVLQAFYLAFWSYVLGITALVGVPVWWLVWQPRANKTGMRVDIPAEQTSGYFDKAEANAGQLHDDNAAPAVPIAS